MNALGAGRVWRRLGPGGEREPQEFGEGVAGDVGGRLGCR